MDKPPDNVYGIFPGIDTTPFTHQPDRSGASDQGWCGEPEPTVHREQAGQYGRRHTVPAMLHSLLGARGISTTRLAVIGLALLTGAGLAATKSLLTTSTATSSSRHITASITTGAAPPTRSASEATRALESRSITTRHHTEPAIKPAARHRPARHSRPSGHTTTTPALTPSATHQNPTPVSYTATTAQPAYTPNTATAASAATAAVPAGPTGRVALIGAGTTPSG